MLCLSFVFFVVFSTQFVANSNAMRNWENNLVLEEPVPLASLSDIHPTLIQNYMENIVRKPDTFNTKPNTTTVISILPIKLSLCKLSSIAEGKTKDQLMKALNYSDTTKIDSCYSSVYEMLEYFKDSDLVLLNKLYVNYSSEVDTSFLTNASIAYGVNVDFVGFNMPRTAFTFINNGIATGTFRRIRDIVEHSDITDQTKMMMITAAHLRATWEVPFDVKETKNRKFHHINNKVSKIPMMSREDSYEVFENRNYKVLTTRLRSSGAAITLVVPTLSAGLPALLAEMKSNPNLMKDARAAMTIQGRKLIMPRLKIKSYLDLTENINKSAVNEILNSNSSGLNGILKSEFRNSSNMFVSKIKQKLFIDVDELGLSRHIISPDDQGWGGPPNTPMESLEFAADRPFYFSFDLHEFVPSDEQLTIVPHLLVAGVYYGPE